MGDHTECFEVDYDPVVISYDDLLEEFWTSHNPTSPSWKTQYASIILAHDDEQLRLAQESAERFSAVVKRPVSTRIERLDRFWMAEDYHQKYYLRNDRFLYREMRDYYPAENDFVDSTASARINGFLAGAGNCLLLERELPKLGLDDTGADHLKKHCRG